MNSTTEICEDKERVKLRKEMLVQSKLEHCSVFGLQDRFGLFHCCYNLDLKTAFLDLGIHMKVVDLCLTESV